MALRCESCGARLTVEGKATTVRCEYCGTEHNCKELVRRQTPQQAKIDSEEKRLNKRLRGAALKLDNGDFDRANELYNGILETEPDCAQAYIGVLLSELMLYEESDLAYFDEDLMEMSLFEQALSIANGEYRELLQSYYLQSTERRILNERTALYEKATQLMNSETSEAFCRAQQDFESLGDFGDSQEMAELCARRAKDYAEHEALLIEEEMLRKQQHEALMAQAWKKAGILVAAMLAIIFALVYPQYLKVRVPILYSAVDEQVAAGNYVMAMKWLESPSNEFAEKKAEVQFGYAQYLEGLGYYDRAFLMYMNLRDNPQAQEKGMALRPMLMGVCNRILNTLLKHDGTLLRMETLKNKPPYMKPIKNNVLSYARIEKIDIIIYDSEQGIASSPPGFEDFIMFVPQDDAKVGLRRDGTVAYSNTFKYKEEVEQWSDIRHIAISEYGDNIIGVKHDGTVVSAGNKKYDTSGFTDIVSVAAGSEHVFGLRSDGTVVVSCGKGHICAIGNWTDIVSLQAISGLTVGLRNDGTVVYDIEHDRSRKEDSLAEVKDAVYVIATDDDKTVAVKSNGSISASGYFPFDKLLEEKQAF